jgi:hypothetical protein
LRSFAIRVLTFDAVFSFVVDRLLYTWFIDLWFHLCCSFYNSVTQVYANAVGQCPWEVNSLSIDLDILCLLWMPKCYLPVPDDFLESREGTKRHILASACFPAFRTCLGLEYVCFPAFRTCLGLERFAFPPSERA